MPKQATPRRFFCSLQNVDVRVATANINGQDTGGEPSLVWMKLLAGVAGTGTLATGILNDHDKTTDCCGIAGVVGSSDHDAR